VLGPRDRHLGNDCPAPWRSPVMPRAACCHESRTANISLGDDLWVISSHSTRSWDSRYWGPASTGAIAEVLRPLITFSHPITTAGSRAITEVGSDAACSLKIRAQELIRGAPALITIPTTFPVPLPQVIDASQGGRNRRACDHNEKPWRCRDRLGR
jgi:hypothetical protein